jgi:uncharacterized protein DUF6843
MARVRAGSIAVFVVSLPVLVGIFIYGPFVLDLFLHRRPPSRFLIPAGYVGWVRIEYRVADAPPLPREGKYSLVQVDRNGGLRTSSDLLEGWAHDQFFYYSGNSRQALSNAGWCKGGKVWGEEIGTKASVRAGQPSVLQKFFVGSEDQFRAEIDPTGKTYSHCG